MVIADIALAGVRKFRSSRLLFLTTGRFAGFASHLSSSARSNDSIAEDEDWLRDVANEMEIEEGVIWVHGIGGDGVMAFTDFGIENLIELLQMYKESPAWLKRSQPD